MKNAEEVLKSKNRPIITVTCDTNILTAVKTMVDNKVGAILVNEGDEIVGMWTERDFMRNMLIPGIDPSKTSICEYMTVGVDTVSYDLSVNELFNEFITHRKRHLLIEKHGKNIGLLGVHDVIKAYYQELRGYVSLQFYEKPLRDFDKIYS